MSLGEKQQRALDGAVRLISKLPPPKGEFKEEHTFWCACKKLQRITPDRFINTGVVTALDMVCEGCKKDFKDLCPIVDVTSKEVVGHIKPHKDKRSGFVFEKGRCYHLDTSPMSDKNCEKSIIIEKHLYEQTIGYKGDSQS